jgi:hypothetical protein
MRFPYGYLTWLIPVIICPARLDDYGGAATAAHRIWPLPADVLNRQRPSCARLQFPKKYVIILKKGICMMHMLDFYEKILYNKEGYNI